MTKKIISYQGEPGAFSEQAAHAYFGRTCLTRSRETFDEIFDDVVRKRSLFAVVPIENSLFGSVHQNYDLLATRKVFIAGELRLRIRLNLMALPGTSLRSLKAVYSHPQAIGQCSKFLGTLRGAAVHPFYDTAGAAKMISFEQRENCAAIAGLDAARHYGLEILRNGIENDHRNYTRFLIVGPRPVISRTGAKTSIIFATKNEPGALFHALAVFALRKINLLKIESRPFDGKPWQYLFFVDLDAGIDDLVCRKALAHLQELTSFFKNLGSYKKGRIVSPAETHKKGKSYR